MSLKARLDRLEAKAGANQPRKWLDLEMWKREAREGVSVNEQERRRLAEYPEHAQAIREDFAAARRNVRRNIRWDNEAQYEAFLDGRGGLPPSYD